MAIREDGLLLELVEDHAAGLAARFDAGSDDVAIAPTKHKQVDLAGSHTRSHVPDVLEGDACESAAPARRDRNSTQRCQDQVAKRFPQVETFVGILPDAVHGVRLVGFSDDILKVDLIHSI